jgi:hypothetical protein
MKKRSVLSGLMIGRAEIYSFGDWDRNIASRTHSLLKIYICIVTDEEERTVLSYFYFNKRLQQDEKSNCREQYNSISLVLQNVKPNVLRTSIKVICSSDMLLGLTPREYVPVFWQLFSSLREFRCGQRAIEESEQYCRSINLRIGFHIHSLTCRRLLKSHQLG